MALVGIGKIALDQHIPAIRASSSFELIAAISSSSPVLDVPVFEKLADALESLPAIDAVVLCTPPSVRFRDAQIALAAGKALMLEKPPARTLEEARQLGALSRPAQSTILASWHSRFAPMVEKAAAWCATRTIVSGRIIWHESVRKWHPGQKWLWEEGGFGVFDPGINALSILSRLLPESYTVKAARYEVPSNAVTPVGVEIEMMVGAASIEASFDFRKEEGEAWDISLLADSGEEMRLSEGGARLDIDGRTVAIPDQAGEYPSLYAYFASLISEQGSEFDLVPLEIVDQANRCAVRRAVEPVFN